MYVKFVSQSSYGRTAQEVLFSSLKTVLLKGCSHVIWSRKGRVQCWLPHLLVPFLLFLSLDNGRGKCHISVNWSTNSPQMQCKILHRFCAQLMVSEFSATSPLRICCIFYGFKPVLTKMEVFIQKLWKEDEERH